jgi:hypothetical protein
MPHTKTDDYRRARHALEATARARRGGVRLEAVNSTEAPPDYLRLGESGSKSPSSLALIMPKDKPRRLDVPFSPNHRCRHRRRRVNKPRQEHDGRLTDPQSIVCSSGLLSSKRSKFKNLERGVPLARHCRPRSLVDSTLITPDAHTYSTRKYKSIRIILT